jgi:hypothetical protein
VLATGAQRDVTEARAEWRDKALTTHAGVRRAQDTLGTGVEQKSEQAIAGAAYLLPDQRTTLRAAAEVDVSGDGGQSADFPNRYILGADYRLTSQSTLFAEQEFARGENLAADSTRMGVRTRPWTGGEIAGSLGSRDFNDSERLYGNLGLVQRWQINERWQTDFGLGRSQTLKSNGVTPLNSNVPLSSGSVNGASDYTTAFGGFHYKNQSWSANGRLEWRTAETDDKVNLFAGFHRQLDAGRSMAAGISLYDTETAAGVHTSKSDVRLSYAWRPNDSRWVWFDRLNFITERATDATSDLDARKIVNNFHGNWVPNRDWQLSVQYGAKYVFDRIDGADYNGYTDLFGTEARYSFDKHWDVGVHASALHSWNTNTLEYGLGASLGYQAFENAWIAVGYNVLGFDDKDFGAAGYRAQGVFVALRMKFDQETLGLNRPDSIFTLNR